MARKDYYGKCGACQCCELGTGTTFAYTTKFTCSYHNWSVKADEKPCSCFDPAPGRTNDMIEQYDK